MQDPVNAENQPNGAGLDRISIHRYRARFVARDRIVAPRTRLPNMLRGTFEMAFRRLVCHEGGAVAAAIAGPC